MSSDRFLEEDFRVLTPEAFDFVLNNELKRAVRSQNFVTLLHVEPLVGGAAGDANVERDQALRQVARLVSREVRETDLLSRTGQGRLSVVLLDSDLESSRSVVERLLASLEHYQFENPLTFSVGAACCPTNGTDVETLRRAAEALPLRQRNPPLDS